MARLLLLLLLLLLLPLLLLLSKYAETVLLVLPVHYMQR